MKTYVVMPHYIRDEQLEALALNAIKSFKDVILISIDDDSPYNFSRIKKASQRVIKNKKNLGFAKSCNKGFKWIFENEKKDCYIICANNDIEINDNVIPALKKPFEEFENVAVTGVRHTQALEVDGKPLREIRGTKITEGGLIGDNMQDGGLWMSKKSVLEKVGVFDEMFERGGFEDVDLFLRMRDTFGMKIIMSEEAIYWHKEGATRWKSGDQFKAECKNFDNENRNKFANKWGFDYYKRQVWESKELIG